MAQKTTQVGFIGLGRMGKPMAVNLLRSGFDLIVYDTRAETIHELTAAGARAAVSSQEVAANSEIVCVCVVDDGQVEDVVTGPRGILEGARRETVVAIHSTISPETARRLDAAAAKKSVRIIDAPISGGEAGARQKSLCYMVGGEAAVIERCREIFAASAAQVFHLGALGSGAAAKMIVQVVTCIHMLAAHEAELLSERCDLDFAAMQKILQASSGHSFVAENWLDRFKLAGDPMEIRRRRTQVFQKSLAPALALAKQLGLSLPGASLTERILPQIMGIEKP
jgi:3-hydroxyisobutyrate dehydrogenase-like beta-hydroxyacid dehydrogenase